ncbi:MAG: flavin reductase family protein [Halioglobus sp.]|jgi:flavin reductase (DIM6/NTAB) family NADH-FMN oxidoreductase RutF
MDLQARQLRDALGRFATGVCLITVVTESGQALALTANSFSSVSLDPPLVLWSLQNSSDVYDTYASASEFAINVLALEQLDLSNLYARKGEHLLDPAHYTLGQHGAPVIRDALVAFECGQHATHEGGDHLIIIGEVRSVTAREEGVPLLFFGGAYRELS